MKYLRISFYVGFLLLVLFATGCTLALPKPSILAGPPNSSVPNGVVTLAPPAGSGVIKCSPPVPSIDHISSFCANQAAGLGGATWIENPSDSAVAKDRVSDNSSFSDNANCSWSQNQTTCSGPQDTKVYEEFCTTCGAPNYQNAGTPSYGAFVCANGYVQNSNGACAPADPNQGTGFCPSGTHYENGLQNCADDATNQLVSACPAGYPYYLPDLHECLVKAYPIVYDCQTFTVPLGECSTPKKSSASGHVQCPAGQTYTCNPMLGGACSCK